MHSDCLCSGFHPNFSVKIYQLLKKIILNVHIVLEDNPSSHPLCCRTIPTYASTKMALALLFMKYVMKRYVCVSLRSNARITLYAKNSMVERSEQELMVMGLLFVVL
jgi:hypothetical protein